MIATTQPETPTARRGTGAAGSRRLEIETKAAIVASYLQQARGYFEIASKAARECGLLLKKERLWLSKTKAKLRQKERNKKKPGGGISERPIVSGELNGPSSRGDGSKAESDWGAYFETVLSPYLLLKTAKLYEKLARIPQSDPNLVRRCLLALDLIPRKRFPKQAGDAVMPRVGSHLALENKLAAFVRDLDRKTQGKLSPALAAGLLRDLKAHGELVDRLRSAVASPQVVGQTHPR